MDAVNPEFRPDAPFVVLDRIEPGKPKPNYCVHGRATCCACPEWVWLGHRTVELVRSGEAQPLCRECAIRLVIPGSRPVGHVEDHRRVDGPHN